MYVPISGPWAFRLTIAKELKVNISFREKAFEWRKFERYTMLGRNKPLQNSNLKITQLMQIKE